MPRETQIIPQWTYPHEEIYINDYSAQELTDVDTGDVFYPYICVFGSSKGVDGKLVNITSLSNYYKMFGKTDYKSYGQPNLMPVAILSQANTTVWGLRVMPEDATYSNSILSLWYKADETNKRFSIKYTMKSLGDGFTAGLDDGVLKEVLRDVDEIIDVANTTDGAPVDGVYVDDEGYTQVPLAVFVCAGRGKYGQNIRWKISANSDYEKDYGIKVFTFEILDVENGATVLKSHIGSMISSTKVSSTVFINDLVEDTEPENLGAYIHVYEENMQKVYDAYVAFCATMIAADPTLDITIPDADEFDIFFGKAVKKEGVRVTPSEPFIQFPLPLTEDVDQTDAPFDEGAYTKTVTVTVNNVAGNSLSAGSDGALDTADTTARQAVLDAAYIKAFEGGYDKLITAPRRIPTTALFDANYSMPVKMALAKLALLRASSILYLDTNIRESLGTTDIATLETNFEPLDDLVAEFENFSEAWLISLNAHDYTIREASTGRRVAVTITYYLASTDADFRANNDLSTARVNTLATLTGHVRNSLHPAIEENEYELKQALYDSRINYFEAVGPNTFTRATQSCYVHNASDLLEENNVIALLQWKQVLTDEARANRYQVTTAQGRAEFREFLMEKYSYLEGEVFASLDIQFRANEYEQRRNIVHMYSMVTFPTISKITIIEIDVNQREFEADEDEEE